MDASKWKKTYIAIDLKTFYASVECVERGLDPLTAKLVVADCSRTEKTICLAVTAALKAYGLSGRSRLYEVVQKAKEIERQTGKKLEYITAVPRMGLYIQYSARIYEVYLKYFSPEDIHVYSIDEVFIDVTKYLPFYKLEAEVLCRKVIQDILAETGITATAGIAPNLYLCKIAMDIVAKHIPADENGVRIAMLDEIEYRKKLWNHRPITDFWRVGNGSAARLEKNGMFTMGDIARRSLVYKQSLYKIFGIDAEILIDHAWGYENCEMKHIKAYRSKASSLGSGQVLHCPYNFEDGLIIVKEMTEALVMDMVGKDIEAQSFTLVVGYDICNMSNPELRINGGTIECAVDYYGRMMPKPAHGTVDCGQVTSSTEIIKNAVVDLYNKIVNPRLLVRRINICANNIVERGVEQPTLFDDVEKLDREKQIQKVVLELQKKYGKNAMLKGLNFEEAGTMRDRNCQIGGHRK